MKPALKSSAPDFSRVALDSADDRTLADMKKNMRSLFQDLSARYQSSGITNEEAIILATATTGFAATCAEQRERAELRVRQGMPAKEKKTP